MNKGIREEVKSPAKVHRKGISVLELTEMFPDEDPTVRWFEAQIWPDASGPVGSAGVWVRRL